MCSGKFVDEDLWAKASHSESASSCGLGCVWGPDAVPFAVLILLHTSAELMLQSVTITGSRIGSSHGCTVVYTLCMQFVLAPDLSAMYVVCMPSVWNCKCAWPS